MAERPLDCVVGGHRQEPGGGTAEILLPFPEEMSGAGAVRQKEKAG